MNEGILEMDCAMLPSHIRYPFVHEKKREKKRYLNMPVGDWICDSSTSNLFSDVSNAGEDVPFQFGSPHITFPAIDTS